MPEVRNALTKALADGLYLRLDCSNDPLQADLDMGNYDIENLTEIRSSGNLLINPAGNGVRIEGNIGIQQSPTATHMIIGSATYTGTGTKIGYGCFPEFSPTSIASNTIVSLQGNVWFGTTNWGVNSFVRALDFFPAPISSGVGSATLDIYGINTGGLLNILGRTVTANTITALGVVPIANIFGGIDNTTANIVRGIYISSATTTTGTWGRLTGLELEPQTSGVINQGLWLSGDGVGSDIVFGAGAGGVGDVTMYYDGTYFNLITDLISPSDFLIDCGTQKTLELVETTFEDLRVSLIRGLTGASNPPSLTQFMDNGAGSVGVYVFAFSYQAVAGNERQMYFAVQLPHGYKNGTNIKPHIHWSPAVTGGVNEFVKWGLEYTWQNIDGTFGNTTIITSDASGASTATISGDTTLTADKHYVSEIGTITGTGKEISSMLVCRIFRNSSHADDNLIQDAFAFEVDFHFEVNTIGSRQEYVK